MSSLGRKPTFSHLVALARLVTWMATVPLFHVHALDIEETYFLPQTFLAHTVFTPDLPGEYSPRTSVYQPGMPGDRHAFPSHFPKYSEIIFTFFSEDNDTKRKVGNQVVYYGCCSFLEPSSRDIGRYVKEVRSPPFLLLASSVSSRAPPFVSY